MKTTTLDSPLSSLKVQHTFLQATRKQTLFASGSIFSYFKYTNSDFFGHCLS